MITRWDLNELSHDDENELYHYGVKGMRWGKHLPGIDAINSAVAKVRAKGSEAVDKAGDIARKANPIINSGLNYARRHAGVNNRMRDMVTNSIEGVSNYMKLDKSLKKGGFEGLRKKTEELKKQKAKMEEARNKPIKGIVNSVKKSSFGKTVKNAREYVKNEGVKNTIQHIINRTSSKLTKSRREKAKEEWRKGNVKPTKNKRYGIPGVITFGHNTKY